ncbi:MAG: hypothetical protein NT141_00655 [candidate division WWE3 bacterium]|nr:hypothetical protein [candidate division WWE3 bacterium]
MPKEVKTQIKNKVKFVAKKDEKDGFACTSCGYSGHGTFDEETHRYICPECGADLEEGDLLKMKTPDSYQEDGSSYGQTNDSDFEL